MHLKPRRHTDRLQTCMGTTVVTVRGWNTLRPLREVENLWEPRNRSNHRPEPMSGTLDGMRESLHGTSDAKVGSTGTHVTFWISFPYMRWCRRKQPHASPVVSTNHAFLLVFCKGLVGPARITQRQPRLDLLIYCSKEGCHHPQTVSWSPPWAYSPASLRS